MNDDFFVNSIFIDIVILVESSDCILPGFRKIVMYKKIFFCVFLSKNFRSSDNYCYVYIYCHNFYESMIIKLICS